MTKNYEKLDDFSFSSLSEKEHALITGRANCGIYAPAFKAIINNMTVFIYDYNGSCYRTDTVSEIGEFVFCVLEFSSLEEYKKLFRPKYCILKIRASTSIPKLGVVIDNLDNYKLLYALNKLKKMNFEK